MVGRFWRSHNDQLLAVEQQNAQLATLRAAYAADAATLERLEKTNVYNDAFCIGHDGVFGTINGLRLGRVPGVPVSTGSPIVYITLIYAIIGRMGRDQCSVGPNLAAIVHYRQKAGLHLRKVSHLGDRMNLLQVLITA